MTKLWRAYLEAHKDEIRAKNLELAAFVVVQTLEALTHAAVVHHPDRLADGQLTREISTLVLRYLRC